MRVSGLPRALAGLRIGLITDLHRSDTVPDELVRRAVQLLMNESPDLVVLGGDYVTWGDRHYVIPVAGGARAPGRTARGLRCPRQP